MLEVTFHEEEKILIARFQGESQPQDVIGKFPAVLKECLARKRDLVLGDFTRIVRHPISTMDLLKIGEGAVILAGKVRKIATFVRLDQHDREEFGITVARNRGVDVAEFTSLDEARAWLLK
jgi:hypothetical protein